jgi:predicted CopG family antitoxin
MTTVTIELPDDLAEQARKMGVLSNRTLSDVVRELVRARAAEDLQGMIRKFDEQPAPPMSMEEIQAIVRQVRAASRA